MRHTTAERVRELDQACLNASEESQRLAAAAAEARGYALRRAEYFTRAEPLVALADVVGPLRRARAAAVRSAAAAKEAQRACSAAEDASRRYWAEQGGGG